MILKAKMRNLIFLIFLTTGCAATIESVEYYPTDYCKVEYKVHTSSGWVLEHEEVPCTSAEHYYVHGYYHPSYKVYVSDFYYYPQVAYYNTHNHYRGRAYRGSRRYYRNNHRKYYRRSARRHHYNRTRRHPLQRSRR